MKIRYKIGDACFNAANAASGQKLNREEIEAAFQRMAEYKQTLQASGNIDGMADKLESFAEREAERTKIAAAMQRRHAALNILVRDRLDQTVTGFINAGMSPRKALLAVLEGTQRGIEGGRNSVGALNMAYEARYIGGLFGELQAKSPHLMHALRDPKLDADIMREMAELKEGGKPGITGNKDAQLVAKTFATYAEMSRTDLNKLGASIGKLDGWAGAQTHDDMKMIAAGKEAWISSILPKLDLARTFPDVSSAGEIEEALSGIYDTLVTGMPNKPTPKELGQRVNPANLAKSLGKSRVLHFKDADAALSYRDEFGFGTTTSGMVAHLRSASRMAANMEALGPNPELMFGSLVDGLKRSIKEDASLSPAEKIKRMKGLTTDAGQLRHAIDISTGMISRPVDVTAAKIGGDIRAVQSMAKLGAAIWSSMSDTVTAGLASQFRGSGFFKGFVAQLDGLRHGRPKGEMAEISYLLGEGFDGIIGHIVSPAAAVDGPVGRLSKAQETFFRWNGLSWWTDIQRASAGRMISAEMGMRAKAAFADLPANYRHVLGLHGIGEKQWEAIRKIEGRDIGGKAYITPDQVRNLPDEAVAGLGKDADTARHDLEMALHRFVADETSYGVIETDARSRRTTTWGTRPGTLAGEGIRFIMQFKGFPIAFSQRVIGRAAFGFRQGAKLEQTAHIGTLIAGLTMAGYAAMTMKDLTRGYWPPRDPTDIKTWEAAFVQGGAAGIYGDYLFGRVNRFGSGIAETAMGPALGTAFDAMDLILKARDASISADEQVKLADWLNFTTQNTPFANLFYVRPALDFLFLNSMREAASPGFMRKTESKRRTQYGQRSIMPKPLTPFN
ncbi:hypothetical protein EN858_15030 [Mesorhizobium sp. M4B.F.Ca.ET.215.01.1.1]|uniref:hypothetical protein n=1 Tax=unclassified Mesorhizobium TaxID=325217 RepID=UPI00109410B7|nr:MULTISPECIES: hypothetical protein [unclassified Mesorhizobium]TGQ11233.1 hypothetical protein EN858_15030 [Mesorhizobium sp. M4B.F.Ca.ET.215.01.1.1]TGR04714.1 hypothetical protein EN846_13050 [Mesorhizobium sp. M4B.F.Ca.ET.203.01.1.1]